MKVFSLFICWLCFAGYASAQHHVSVHSYNSLHSSLDSVVPQTASKFMREPGRMGLSIGILKADSTFFYNYGTIQRSKQQSPDAQTIYEIGSVSKTFTGLLLAQAIKDGKIKLSDDVRKYLTGDYSNLAYRDSGISILHLATHTSGLPAFLPDRPDIFRRSADSIALLLAAAHAGYTKAQFLSDLRRVKPDTFPGADYRYSNAGAQLMGFILERVYGQSFGELIQRFILKPAGMTKTFAKLPGQKSQLATGYDGKGRMMPYLPKLMAAAGGLYSTPADMVRYMRLQLSETDSVIWLSHKVAQRYSDNSGIGMFWRLNSAPGGRRIWHTGGTFGFSSYCVIYPEQQLGIVLLSNEFDPKSQGGLVGVADALHAAIVAVRQ